MEQPPPNGDPYTDLQPGLPNFGQQGVVHAWDTVRWFWGGTAQQGWIDLANIAMIGEGLV